MKPFKKREIIVRISAIIRRSRGRIQTRIKTGILSVNLGSWAVEVKGKPVHLTIKKFGILENLVLCKDIALTKKMFLSHLYSSMAKPKLKIIDVFFCKLRKTLCDAMGDDNYIHTVWNHGHVLRDPME
jgi:two-component system cell cycle response regulator CtrA